MSPRQIFYALSLVTMASLAGLTWWQSAFAAPLAAAGFLVLLGLYDVVQTTHSIRRNFPIAGRFRYIFESVRPELQQYFVESNASGRPFSRDLRSLVYQRAKNVTDTVPFGTEKDVYEVGYEWINHSLVAKHPHDPHPRVTIGGPDCDKPYDAALLNVSAMSYGALSTNAIRALNRGAKLGGFAHNTGEGGLSPYHLEEGGDLVWQVGTGYFGCRDDEGKFDPARFAEKAALANVKMIEIKLSQGAKPGHGGILPAAKVTPEIARIRNVPMGADVLSPPSHRAFSTPLELCEFIATLRKLSGGKPIGFKLCVGKRREFLAVCKAMVESGITPDFITVDGGEGGTGAAPLEFSNVVGTPLVDGLVFVHNALVGSGLRDRIRVIASGRIVTGFDIAHKLAIGADLCNSARAMMFALGCIQAQRCNSNTCPTGIATEDPQLVRGLVVDDKAVRVASFQRNTVRAFTEILAAAGLSRPSELRPWHILRRISSTEAKHYGEIYEYLKRGALLGSHLPKTYARAWNAAQAFTFDSATNDRPSLHVVDPPHPPHHAKERDEDEEKGDRVTSLTENVPNEPGAWDDDWSFAYLEKLYAELQGRFSLALLGDAAEAIAAATESAKRAFVRHDVDVSLRLAGELARREVGWKVCSTYHVMIDSPFYDVRSAESVQILSAMRAQGHEVGLHYDVVARGMLEADRATREEDIGRACETLAEIAGAPVRSVSFHLPVQDLLRGPLRVAGRVSGYAEDLFRWYISDSRARWREGEPIASLDRPRSNVLQILVHPVWWGETSERPELRLRAFVEALATERNVPYGPLRDRMSDHILYRAADCGSS